MPGRYAAFLLAFALATAPLALELCDVVCSGRPASHAVSMGDSCHHETQESIFLRGTPRCGDHAGHVELPGIAATQKLIPHSAVAGIGSATRAAVTLLRTSALQPFTRTPHSSDQQPSVPLRI